MKYKKYKHSSYNLRPPNQSSGPQAQILELEACGSVCKVGTQDPENLDEELKPLVTAWSHLGLR